MLRLDHRHVAMYPDGGAALFAWLAEHGVDAQHCRSVTVTDTTVVFELYAQPVRLDPNNSNEALTHERRRDVLRPLPLPPTWATHPQ